MRIRVLITLLSVALLAACGGGDGDGALPTIGGAVTIPDNVPSVPSAIDVGTLPVAAEPGATQPAEPPAVAPPVATSPVTQPDTPTGGTVAGLDTLVLVDDDGSTVWWPWVLIAFVIVGVVVAVASRGRNRPSWQTRTSTMLDEIDQLTSHLTAMTPEGIQAIAAADAAKLAELRATHGELVTSAPDGSSQMVLRSMTGPMADLHAAVDAVALSVGPPTDQLSGGRVVQLAGLLHTTSASVRAALAGAS